MAEKVSCATHGEQQPAYVCSHLLGESVALGFNRNDPTDQDPYPDAWCDDCELIRAAHNGWNEESEDFVRISLICVECYERSRIRNTRPTITLKDLDGLRWKCSSCEEWHTGPCLDFSYDWPDYWQNGSEKNDATTKRVSAGRRRSLPTFLDEDYCAIEGRDFFVRGIIELPVIGTGESFCWGVWGSLSQQNFKTLVEMDKKATRTELQPMFSWLSNRISEYPDTLNLKMYAHIQEPGWRPKFELEPTDHPLAIEHRKGIEPRRVKEFMMGRVPRID